MAKPASKGHDWKFAGTGDESSLKEFCREKCVFFSDFVKVQANYELLHGYQEFFDVWEDG
jgi:hypothetical protein